MTEQLIQFVIEGNLEEVKKLIEKGANLDYQDRYDEETVLMMAICCGHLEIAKFLIEKGAKLDLQNKYGDTALDMARERGYEEIVELLTTKN